jgi:hypothetical protein
MGFYLSETKQQLKLAYDVVVSDHGDGRVTIQFTLADEGRLKPLDDVQFLILAKEKKDGGYAADLVFSIQMRKGQDGKSVGNVSILKELAERADIVLNTHTLDGKLDGMTRLHHAIPVKNYMNKPAPPPAANPPAAPGAAPASPARPAAEPKKN